jgi:hypothetical protein
MKVAAAVIMILAVAIAVVPQFTDCHSDGRALTLQDGRQIPMKCHWTAQAELGLGLPILAVGTLIFGSRRKESLRNLGFLGIALGAIVVTLPTNLIGVCGNPDMICNSTMKPALILMGVLVGGISLGVVVQSFRKGSEVV